MLDVERPGGVVDNAVAVVVVANGAVKLVVAEDAVEGFALGGFRADGGRGDFHAVGGHSRAGADELAVDFHEAGVAGLDGAELRMIANLGNLDAGAVHEVEQTFAEFRLTPQTVNLQADAH